MSSVVDGWLCPAPPRGGHPVGQQEIHEHEALGGGHGRRLYCRLTSLSRSLQIILRINLDGTRIHEEVLDAKVQACAETVRKQCAEELKKLVQMQKMWALRKPILDAHILSLQEKVQVLEQEIDEIVMEKIIHQT